MRSAQEWLLVAFLHLPFDILLSLVLVSLVSGCCLSLLVLIFPPIILCRAGFVDRYWVNLVLSWNILVFPSMVIESFAGYSSFGWHFCSLRDCMRSTQDLLSFIVSGEKSGVILIGLPLYVTLLFSLTAFNILSLFSTFGVLIMM